MTPGSGGAALVFSHEHEHQYQPAKGDSKPQTRLSLAQLGGVNNQTFIDLDTETWAIATRECWRKSSSNSDRSPHLDIAVVYSASAQRTR